jgi:HD-like signal output (HDOD) protein
MRAWGMPQEFIAAIRWHHREHYQGKWAVYSRLALIADHLLKRYGIGDAPSDQLPPQILEALGLSGDQAVAVTSRIVERGEALDELARQLVT